SCFCDVVYSGISLRNLSVLRVSAVECANAEINLLRRRRGGAEKYPLLSKLKTSMVYGPSIRFHCSRKFFYEIDTTNPTIRCCCRCNLFHYDREKRSLSFYRCSRGCDSVVCRQLSQEEIAYGSPVHTSLALIF